MKPLNQSDPSIRQKIIDIVTNEHGRPIPADIILKKLAGNQVFFNEKKKIYWEIDNLIDQGTLKKLVKSKLKILKFK